VGICYGQQSEGIAAIEKAITDKKIQEAEGLLQAVVTKYYNQQKADSLVHYVYYTGKVSQAKSNPERAVKQVQLFIEKIKTLTPGPATLRQAYIECGEYFGSAGKNKLAYKANEEAFKYALQIPNKTGADLGMICSNLSTYAQRMGDIDLAKQNQRKGLQFLLQDKPPRYDLLFTAYNGMGSMMWYASKTDSALYYFTKALEALAKTERTPLNQYYRPAVVQNNLSALYQMQGKTTEGINAMKLTIENIRKFLATKDPHPKKTSAITFQFEATDNLAGIYKEIGDLKQARQLLEYSYQQKQQHLGPNEPGIFISQILLGQLYYAMKDFDKALHFLNNGLQMISKADGDYLFWQADACSSLGLLHDKKKDYKTAAGYYERADSLYEASLQGEYDNIYLEFLSNAALFYAERRDTKRAIAKAKKGYNYVLKTQGAETLLAFYQLLNLSEVYNVCGSYKEALAYSRKGLDVINKMINKSDNLLDSVKLELKKPRAVLLKTKSEYQLLSVKNVANLTALLNQLNEALAVLERRKAVVTDAEDIGVMMSDNTEVVDFLKKINLDLYNLTHDQSYINNIIGLHESGLYNRIRSRLDKNKAIQFAHLPVSVQQTEKKLKAAIATSFDGNKTYHEKMQGYFSAVQKWNAYQDKLRADYPKYYNMRYASIFTSLGNIQQAVPAGTSLIRYFFIDKDLFAFVVDNQHQQIFKLNAIAIEKQITEVASQGQSAAKTGELLYGLYQQLWAPLAPNIRYKKVIIIPDGILYNLSFEILTPQKVNGFKELSGKSLLASYTISYQYSLFLLQHGARPSDLGTDFIAFAPGFSDEVKAVYKTATKDSLKLDNNYLSLLPQPFSVDLATEIKDLLGGKAFINDQSTEGAFKATAANNKIIHIGTHAESNNEYPQFSRLIFAKNVNEKDDDNSLYVDEIYNCDLTSNLTVLTACESGKPGYQDGEGMISLAHAFNYAGSESILTGLWRIDEQASALLMESFYDNLLKGLSKDEALRLAKLAYLEKADGRMLSPQYWAGLVIMGDTAPIVFQQKRQSGVWIVFGIIAILGVALYVVSKRSNNRKLF